jgi:hypothetical protein
MASESMHLEDLSSAEEQQQRRGKIRRKTTGMFHRRSQLAPKPIASIQHRPILDAPELKTFSELVAENTHIKLSATETDCSLIGQKKASSGTETSKTNRSISTALSSINDTAIEGALSDAALEANHALAYGTNPSEFAMLQVRLNALPEPMYYPREIEKEMSRKQMNDALRRRQLFLPVMNASHEQDLMQEAGSFTHPSSDYKTVYEFPACVFATKCVGQVHFGVILTATMLPEEYTAFLFDQKQPATARPCILCCRKTICDYVLHMRYSRCVTNEDTAQSQHGTVFLREGQQDVYQLYRSLVNKTEGYFDTYVLFPRAEEAIIDPIVLLNLSSLKPGTDVTTGRRFIDQTVMVWRSSSTLKPTIGEHELHFCGGAGN